MRRFASIAGSRCGASLCALAFLVTASEARPQAVASFDFRIDAKPRLSALADFTTTTGIQVVRLGGGAISGTSPAVSGRLAAESALREILSGSNLTYRFTGPRTVAIESSLDIAIETISVSEASIGRGGVSEIDITSADIERRNATDLRGVFRGEPSVVVGSSLPMSQKLYVQGIDETNLAISIDGSRQNNKVFHHNATTMIDPNLLRALRVDAGVAPADSGPGALGGAIAYLTKDARDFLAADGFGGSIKSTFNLNGNVSTTNLTSYSRQGGFEALGSFTYGKGSEFRAGNDEQVLGSSTNVLSGLGKLAYQSAEGRRLSISHELIRDDAIRPFRANAVQIYGPQMTPLVRPYTLDRQNTVVTYSNDSAEGWWDPNVVLGYNRTQVAVDQYAGATLDTYSHTSKGLTDSLNGKLENKFALPIGDIVAGIDFYRDRARSIEQTYRTAETADNVGAYAQARLKLANSTKLSFGLRGDHQQFGGINGFRSSDHGLSSNVSGEHALTSHLTAKAGYSNVWAGVPLAENYVQNPAWNYGAGPRSVTSDNATAGLVAHFARFRIEGGVFRTRIWDARVPLWAAAMALRAFDVQSQGFHIGSAFSWDDGFVRLRFVRTDATISGRPADSYFGKYLTAPIGDILTVQVEHRFAPLSLAIGGDVEIAFEDDSLLNPVTGIGRLDGYEVVNLFAEHRPIAVPSLTLRGDVRNLLNQTYAARGTYGLEYGSGIVRPLYDPGRSYLVSAKLTF
ncbi:hemoglobin/transferrin/lactoferrin receptor protein [Rhodopseudomonas faecalis]|uniref:Hemoglobin/transferrin/lactoferrin receptor protein n=1 Tax=Rhodopseudomonas faecalis TaxID=99655 RepID=A0A318TLM0_9BRAD|nr:hemoglobin/transferrin/lactoferrin receptor protein [Rhodopseudomonas faecalis]